MHAHGPGLDENGGCRRDAGHDDEPRRPPTARWRRTCRKRIGALALTMTIDPNAIKPDASANPNADSKPNAKPVNIAAQADKASVEMKLGGVKPQAAARPLGFPGRPSDATRTRRQRGGVQDAADGGARQPALARRRASECRSSPCKRRRARSPSTAPRWGIGGAAAGSASRFEEHFSASRPHAAARPRPRDVPRSRSDVVRRRLQGQRLRSDGRGRGGDRRHASGRRRAADLRRGRREGLGQADRRRTHGDRHRAFARRRAAARHRVRRPGSLSAAPSLRGRSPCTCAISTRRRRR